MKTENMLPIAEISKEFFIDKNYIAVLVEAGFVQGSCGDDIKNFMVDKESFQKWLVERKNGWRLPSPPELAHLIETRKNSHISG
jgi:hypothetical protein